VAKGQSGASQRAATRRGKKVLAERAPRHVENAKKALLMLGGSHSGRIKQVLTELAKLKAPLSKKLSRSNPDVYPFETGKTGLLETMARRNDCSLFALGSHTKKRPHNLVLGRMFDSQLLDVFELGVESLTLPHELDPRPSVSAGVGLKPAIVFTGDVNFEATKETQVLKNFLLDFFRGEDLDELDVPTLDRVIVLSLHADGKALSFRQYRPRWMRSKAHPLLPRVELDEIGPRMEWTLRRSQLASDELAKAALRRSRHGVEKKKKNISRESALGDTVGRIHVGKQDMGNLVLARPKALRRGSQRGIDPSDSRPESTSAESSSPSPSSVSLE